MTTFNTGNPLGSTDVYDRYDNSENLDNFSNGPLGAYPDRFGVSRKSLAGMEAEFDAEQVDRAAQWAAFLLASGYQVLGPYGAGLVFTAPNQLFSYLGEFYAPSAGITLPYTTTGTGAAEIATFRSVGDAVLRSDLAGAAGSSLVGFSQLGGTPRTIQAKLMESCISVKDFGAIGDGITDDKAAIQSAVDHITYLGGGRLYFPTGDYLIKGAHSPIENNSRLVDGVTLTSNLTIYGDGASSNIICDPECANVFVFGRFRAAVTSSEGNIKNVHVSDIQISRQPSAFFEQNYQLWIDSAENVTIDNVIFNGWSGDAIIIGNILSADAGAWLQSKADNIRVSNCVFDGVDKNNRQAISIFSGSNIEICNNAFSNTTRVDMPGAIDLEPELATNILYNILIHDNTFHNIGGATGVVSLALYAELSYGARSIVVDNNTFTDTTNEYLFGVFGPGAVTDTMPAHAASHLSFSGNMCSGTQAGLFYVAGVVGCKITGNYFHGSSNGSLIAYYDGRYHQVSGLVLSNNVFKECYRRIPSDSGLPLISVHGKLLSSAIEGNTFITSGIINTSTATFGAMQIFGFDGFGSSLQSSYVSVTNNIVNGSGVGFLYSYPVFSVASAMSYPELNTMLGNSYTGNSYKEHGDPLSLYTKSSGKLPLEISYSSVLQTITSGGLLTLAHGLGESPSIASAELFCAVAEYGYSVGDVIQVHTTQMATDTSINFGMTLVKGVTNIYVRFGSATFPFLIGNLTTGVTVPATNGNWRLVVKAWL